jgi:hypothetical protein
MSPRTAQASSRIRMPVLWRTNLHVTAANSAANREPKSFHLRRVASTGDISLQ